eukprot:scaffold71725_cov84-Phaeocystis_antarctica.AAC.10
MSRSRLAKLSHAQILEIAVDACESSPELKNKADALIAKVAPLPSWCVDILLSPDLLPQLFSSLGLSEHAAAGVCSTWSRAYSRQLRRSCYIDTSRVRLLADVPKKPNSLCMLPGGVLAITHTTHEPHNGRKTAVTFVAARNDSDPQALVAYRASSLAARRFEWLTGLARTNDGLLACNLREPSAMLYKFALDGSMDELATAPALADYAQGTIRCAVHQQTQRTYAVVVDWSSNAVVLLDANLQVVATVEAVGVAGNDPIRDIAVHGDQVIVLTGRDHDKGPGLRLLDLDGRFLRTITNERFRNPQSVTASHGRAFVVDDDDDNIQPPDYEPGKVLHVIDIQSGDVLQSVSIDLIEAFSAILVDGDEIFISGYKASKVIVLRYAGSEA